MRRNDLDWLRVIAFALLIFYHVGMFFVPWGFHIKNNQIYHWLTYPMLFLNQWRLPLLFVISGMGTLFALSKRNGWQFTGERIRRLFVPLVFGMLVIVPPQVFVERLARHQFSGSYLDFWPSQAFKGAYPAGNLSWHHLWFLPYLLIFSLVLLPLFLYFRKRGSWPWLNRLISTRFGLFWFIVPLYFIEAFIEPFFPVTHALVGDWFTLINCCTLFLFGFLLMLEKEVFWKMVIRFRRRNLLLGVFAFTILMLRNLYSGDSYPIHFTEAFVKVFNLWSWILALFGYAAVYLNRPGKFISYANEAVYPFYILHQTVMLIIGYFLMDLPYGFFIKFSIMVLGTFFLTWTLYEFGIRRWSWIRPLFGLKARRPVTQANNNTLNTINQSIVS